jgi:hypothetical protein
MTRLLAVLLSAAIGSAGPPTKSLPIELQDEQARAHFSTGMDAWGEKDLATAQRELEAAYAIEAEPQLLYALGQLARLRGDCDRARERFTAYLATNPSEKSAKETRVNMERCTPAEPEVSAPPPEPKPPIDTTPPVIDQPPPPKPRPDGLGIGLTTAGSVLAVVGVGLFGGSFVERNRAEDEAAVDDFERRVKRSTAEYWSGVALMSVGGALLVGGIVRLVLVRKRRAARASR